jgi:hypothetical protein
VQKLVCNLKKGEKKRKSKEAEVRSPPLKKKLKTTSKKEGDYKTGHTFLIDVILWPDAGSGCCA